MSYGPNQKDMFLRSANYEDKILKGAKPAELPIEQPTKFEFVVNLKTAKALGLVIPQSELIRADEVIQVYRCDQAHDGRRPVRALNCPRASAFFASA